mgnify:CR=1 FL=1
MFLRLEKNPDRPRRLAGRLVTCLMGSYWMYDEHADPETPERCFMAPSDKEWTHGMIGLVIDERHVEIGSTSYPYVKILTSSGDVGWVYEMWCLTVPAK